MASQKIFNNPINTQSFETNDYNRFKHLTGNRTLQKESDIHKLMLSLQQHGWIGEHVIVNENDEVIDGQNRIEACRRLNIPFRYTVIPGLTINDCIILNSNKRNWDVNDYVKSFAEQGFDDYVWIKNIHELYPSFALTIILALAGGNGYTTDLKKDTKENIINGGLDITIERRKLVIDTLEYLSKFIPATKYIKGRLFMLYNALIWWHNEANSDETRLVYAVNRYANNPRIFPDKLSTEGFVHSIQNAYNYNRPAHMQIHIKDKYDMYTKYTKK